MDRHTETDRQTDGNTPLPHRGQVTRQSLITSRVLCVTHTSSSATVVNFSDSVALTANDGSLRNVSNDQVTDHSFNIR